MAAIILVEMGLACVLAAVLGYFLGKLKGVKILGGVTLALNAFTLILAYPAVSGSNSLDRPEVIILQIAIWTCVLGGALGYFLTDLIGPLLVEAGTMGAALVCIYSTVVLSRLNEWLGAISVLVVAILIVRIGMAFGKAILRDQRATSELGTKDGGLTGANESPGPQGAPPKPGTKNGGLTGANESPGLQDAPPKPGTQNPFLSLIVEIGVIVATFAGVYFTARLGGSAELLGALGLLIAVILIGTIGIRKFSEGVLRGKGAHPLRVLWFGFCATCLIGYWVAGYPGLLLITLPTVLIFWGFLYFISGLVLPVQGDERAQQENHRRQAFRSLITFGLGTNYPYYVIEDWKTQENKDQAKPDPRVPGNSFSQFLAGPGIIVNDCNHVAVTTTGFRLQVKPPGLSFTEKYEELYAVVDLRTQLRTCTIKAETQDGIGVSIFTFFPHRIGADGHQPALGKPYPYDEKDVLQAVFYKTLVEHKWERDDKGQATEDINKTPWDELMLAVGPPILKKIILGYTCNELHTPGDPRVEITKEFRKQLKDAMAPLGIETVGGGISDIMPSDEVVEQRIQTWEAKWKSKIEVELGEAEAETTRQLELVWTQAQLRMMYALAGILEVIEQGGTIKEVLAFQLIEATAAIAPGEPDQKRALEDSSVENYFMLRGR